MLLDALAREGFDDRVEVIRSAAQRNGSINRDEVYRIAGMSEADRSLRQFATPALRHGRAIELSSDELVQDLSDPLIALYDGPGKALGYSVPAEFVEFEYVLAFLRERALSQTDHEPSVPFPLTTKGMIDRHLFDSSAGIPAELQVRVSKFVARDLRSHRAAPAMDGDSEPGV